MAASEEAMIEQSVEILPPDYVLRKLIGDEVDLQQVFGLANIEKAQAVIDQNRDSFAQWVMKDIEQLEKSYALASADPASCEDEIRKLARTAFIIKSQAGTFGFGLATIIAKSLDDFCNKHFRPNAAHMTVIRKHIDTLAAIFNSNITGDGGPVGKELSDNFLRLVEKFKDR